MTIADAELDPAGFLQGLSAAVTSGEVRLPSFPGFTTRVLKVLDDPRATPAQVGQVVGADAALAARVLRLANSAFLRPSGSPITDLHQAVTRLGHQLIRCTALSFALKQMEFTKTEAVLRPQLQELWRRGTLVAAIAFSLARESKAARPDEALIAGLMHNVGRLYILSNAPRSATEGEGIAGWDGLVYEWHPRIARAILEQWEFPADITAAVGEQNNWTRVPAGGADLTDVLSAATALVPCVFYRELLDNAVTAVPPFKRLGLDAADCMRLLAACGKQIKSLQSTLAA